MFTFEIGEKARNLFGQEVEIISKELRPEYFKNREQYVVRRKFLFWHKHEIELQVNLTKIIP